MKSIYIPLSNPIVDLCWRNLWPG